MAFNQSICSSIEQKADTTKGKMQYPQIGELPGLGGNEQLPALLPKNIHEMKDVIHENRYCRNLNQSNSIRL